MPTRLLVFQLIEERQGTGSQLPSLVPARQQPHGIISGARRKCISVFANFERKAEIGEQRKAKLILSRRTRYVNSSHVHDCEPNSRLDWEPGGTGGGSRADVLLTVALPGPLRFSSHATIAWAVGGTGSSSRADVPLTVALPGPLQLSSHATKAWNGQRQSSRRPSYGCAPGDARIFPVLD